MKFRKQGLILKADGQREWMYSHIQTPYAYIVGDRVRVFFTSRPKPVDGLFKSVTSYFDLDRDNLKRVIEICDSPILSFGKTGTFDEFGIMPGPIIKKDRECWMYYEGWSRLQSVPYAHAVGIAITNDMRTFRKYSEGPVLSDTPDEPYRLYSIIGDIKEDNNVFHMYYGSGVGWEEYKGGMEAVYLIRHAASSDGLNWNRDSAYLIEKGFDDECQAPGNVFKVGDDWHMLFSYRHSLAFRNKERGYRIGHAVSKDLINWRRDGFFDNFKVSEEGWDSEMICYPFVLKLDDEYVVFYCGNGFGASGLGYAYIDF